MEGLRRALLEVVAKIRGSSVIDERALRSILRDVQRALLKADVSVGLVAEISRRIEERVKREDLPPGFSRRELLLKVLYEELMRMLGGEARYEVKVRRGKPHVIMLVGIQGSGKTTTAAKLAYFFKNRGYRVGLVCADNFRPGAYDQLKQLAEKVGAGFYGERDAASAVELARRGVERLRSEGYDIIIVDTAGRHKEESGLLAEMKEMAEAIGPDEIALVLDGTMGKQAGAQAEAFHRATPIGSIIVTKLDGSAKGGGALAAVVKTGARISFIGVGEGVDELELFDPPSFVSRLLGMGDIRALVERFRRYEALSEARAKAMAVGKLTLLDLKEQFESLTRAGPFQKLLDLIPGMAAVPDEIKKAGEENVRRWLAIMDSMTAEELLNPDIIDRSRMVRIAKGSGTTLKDVKNLLTAYRRLKKTLKRLAKQRRRLEQMLGEWGF